MTKNHIGLASTLLCMAALVAPAAQAAGGVSGAITELQFALVDLDPNDGIAPSITWSALSNSVYAAGKQRMDVVWQDPALAQGGWSPTYLDTLPEGAAFDTTDPFGSLATSAGSAQASLAATQLSASYQAVAVGGEGVAMSSLLAGFELSPMTKLLVSARLALAIEAPGGEAAWSPNPAGTVFTDVLPFASHFAFVSLGFEDVAVSDGGLVDTASLVLDAVNHVASTDAGANSAPILVSESQWVQLSLSNVDANTLQAKLSALVSVNGSQLATQTPAVPEPAAAGLALVGALLALAQRRRATCKSRQPA